MLYICVCVIYRGFRNSKYSYYRIRSIVIEIQDEMVFGVNYKEITSVKYIGFIDVKYV